jgi:hypothetical protein
MSAFVINSYAFGGEDPDAKTYLDAVESADTQALEAGVRKAVDDFVKGCKSDGIWSAIKASCILAGARTLTGALTPLVGSAPTNNSNAIVSADYNRKNGIICVTGTPARFLDTNRANNADPQNSQHMAIYLHTLGFGTVRFIGSGASTGDTCLLEASSNFGVRSRNSSNTSLTSSVSQAPVFFGKSRASSTNFDWRVGATSGTASVTSQTSSSGTIEVFRAGAAAAISSRIAFYSIGESLDLSLLRTRVDTLIADIGTAIP